MGSNTLRFEFEWFDPQVGSSRDQYLSANISLVHKGRSMTRVEDLAVKTTRPYARVCAYRLGMWLAANWWRLRWEPGQLEQDTNWRLAHCMAAAGGGFIWPDAVFVADGKQVMIEVRPREPRNLDEGIRHPGHEREIVSTEVFEHCVDEFLNAVVSRLLAFEMADDPLVQLWAEIHEERNSTAEHYQFRKLEAMAGFDPDDAPSEFVDELLKDQNCFGVDAVEELAAATRQGTLSTLKEFHDLPKGVPTRLVDLPRIPAKSGSALQPHEQAMHAAQEARGLLNLPPGPLTDQGLADVLGVPRSAIAGKGRQTSPMPIALQPKEGSSYEIHFHRPGNTTRRFAAARLLGDRLMFGSSERLIPATNTKTFRQKTQRAFAHEFLCPTQALLEFIQSDAPTDDDIAEAADHFHVSPLTIHAKLVYQGLLKPFAADWVQ